MRCTTPVRFVSHRSCIRLQDGRVASRVLTRRLNMAWQLPKSQNTPPALPACSSRSAVTRTQSRSVIPAHAVTPPGISHRKLLDRGAYDIDYGPAEFLSQGNSA